ncbi:unnamed protein product [Polarella glacialis]|uniref:Uncharacterized protein n=1 Tax=Polarella glacialis TaxID=89957 RepID=A0A813I3T5_POLGL|nr:unnamed protein product [Polarella glacialis]
MLVKEVVSIDNFAKEEAATAGRGESGRSSRVGEGLQASQEGLKRGRSGRGEVLKKGDWPAASAARKGQADADHIKDIDRATPATGAAGRAKDKEWNRMIKEVDRKVLRPAGLISQGLVAKPRTPRRPSQSFDDD